VIEAVLFDLDGTLLDTAPDLVATLNHLRAGLGLSALPLDELRHFVSRGAPGLIKAGMPPCDDETLAVWRKTYLFIPGHLMALNGCCQSWQPGGYPGGL